MDLPTASATPATEYLLVERDDDLRPHVQRLIERLRVHATSAGTGFLPDPDWAGYDEGDYDPTPGESGQWSWADQVAIAAAERALADG